MKKAISAAMAYSVMARHKKLLLLALLVGCGPMPPQPPQNYEAYFEVQKANGQVKTVVVRFPGQGSVTVSNRENLDRLIQTMEGVVADLKDAKDHFPIVEPPVKEGTFQDVVPRKPSSD